MVNLLDVTQEEKIAAIIPVRGFDSEQYLFFSTENGTVKKTKLEAYRNVRASGIIAINIDEGDRLIGVELTNGDSELVLVTRLGQGIRFHEKDVRPMGRSAGGVRGIMLADGDAVESIEVVHEDAMLLSVTENGYGKRTAFSDYRIQRRGGKGLIANDLTAKTGNMVTALSVHAHEAIMLVTRQGTMIRMPVDGIRITGRAAQGVKLIDLDDGDVVMSATPVEPEDETNGNGDNGDVPAEASEAPVAGEAPEASAAAEAPAVEAEESETQPDEETE